MKVNRAIITIQELNCQKCAIELANRLSQVKEVSHLDVYYKSSEVCFNFQNIKGVSDVENILTDLGFNPLGEHVKEKKENGFFCRDASKKLCIDGF